MLHYTSESVTIVLEVVQVTKQQGPTTSFERVFESAETAVHIPDGYKLHSRLFDGQHLFTVTRFTCEVGNDPVPGGGYSSIAAAIAAKVVTK